MGLGHSQIRPWSPEARLIVWVLTAIAEGTALGKGSVIRTIPPDRLEVPPCGLLSIPLWTKVGCHVGDLLWEEAYGDSTRCWHSCHINTDLKGDGCPFSGGGQWTHSTSLMVVKLFPDLSRPSSPALIFSFLGEGSRMLAQQDILERQRYKDERGQSWAHSPLPAPTTGMGVGIRAW